MGRVIALAASEWRELWPAFERMKMLASSLLLFQDRLDDCQIPEDVRDQVEAFHVAVAGPAKKRCRDCGGWYVNVQAHARRQHPEGKSDG